MSEVCTILLCDEKSILITIIISSLLLNIVSDYCCIWNIFIMKLLYCELLSGYVGGRKNFLLNFSHHQLFFWKIKWNFTSQLKRWEREKQKSFHDLKLTYFSSSSVYFYFVISFSSRSTCYKESDGIFLSLQI